VGLMKKHVGNLWVGKSYCYRNYVELTRKYMLESERASREDVKIDG
jgi:hypothetical protein